MVEIYCSLCHSRLVVISFCSFHLHIFPLSFYDQSVTDFDLVGLIWIMLWYANLFSQHKFHALFCFSPFFLRIIWWITAATRPAAKFSLWLNRDHKSVAAIFCFFLSRSLTAPFLSQIFHNQEHCSLPSVHINHLKGENLTQEPDLFRKY